MFLLLYFNEVSPPCLEVFVYLLVGAVFEGWCQFCPQFFLVPRIGPVFISLVEKTSVLLNERCNGDLVILSEGVVLYVPLARPNPFLWYDPTGAWGGLGGVRHGGPAIHSYYGAWMNLCINDDSRRLVWGGHIAVLSQLSIWYLRSR